MKNVKPESVKVRERLLPVCSHGECQDNRIWDFPTCWIHLTELERQELRHRVAAALRAGEDLRNTVLTGADLQKFDFSGIDLSGVFFNGCHLLGCRFVDTNLSGAFFGGANLAGADLTRATLHRAVFSGAYLSNVKLLAYSLRGGTPVNLHMDCFGGIGIWHRPHINESNPSLAGATYQSLKKYFLDRGDYDSASWSAYSERLMQRKASWKKGEYFRWLNLFLFSSLCGYGEKPIRVFLISLVLVLIYSIVYKLFDFLVSFGQPMVITWADALYFSAATFTGLSFPDLIPRNNPVIRLFVTSERFGGLFALGLFIFTLTKRYVAR